MSLAKAIAIMGREPVNPVGQCFESAIRQACFAEYPDGVRVRLCHGIGIATMPGQSGNRMGHAWVEVRWPGGHMALDTTWGVQQTASVYRQKLQLELVQEYAPKAALALWKLHNMPGPWHPEIRALTDRVGRRP